MDITVVFIVFNRPELTARVFQRIRNARPARLLVIGDGPRRDTPEDVVRIGAVRQIVEKGIDWPCTLTSNFAETNMGCRARVASGIDWAFSNVEEAIILEDDCLPDPTFFLYASEMLEKYRDDPRVFHIGGNNFCAGKPSFDKSYKFSRYGHIWGWATWRRAWAYYEWDMSSWKNAEVRREILADLELPDERGYWGSIFDQCAAKPAEQTTWDYQWTYACWKNRGLSTYPASHLVQNIGQGKGATHTHIECRMLGKEATPLPIPICHPSEVAGDAVLDRENFRAVFMAERPWAKKLLDRLYYNFKQNH